MCAYESLLCFQNIIKAALESINFNSDTIKPLIKVVDDVMPIKSYGGTVKPSYVSVSEHQG